MHRPVRDIQDSKVEAYSPLTRGERLTHQNLSKVAKKYGKTSAQILIRWSLQHGLIAIPKSIHKERIRENSEIFDFQLKPEDMQLLDSLNENLRSIFELGNLYFYFNVVPMIAPVFKFVTTCCANI